MGPLTLLFLALALIMDFFLLKFLVNRNNSTPEVEPEEPFIVEDAEMPSEEREELRQYTDFLTDEPLGPETRIIEVPTPDGKVRAEVNKKTAARFAKYGLKAFPGFKARLEASRNGVYTGKYYRVSEPDSYDIIDFLWDYYFFTEILGLFNDSVFDYMPMDDPSYEGYVDPDYSDSEMERTDAEAADDVPEDVFVDSEPDSSAVGEPTEVSVEDPESSPVEEPDVEDLDRSTIDIAVDSVAEEASERFDSEDASEDVS